MGLLLKIALLAAAAWGVWMIARRWYGILGGGAPKPPAPPPAPQQRPPPQPSARARIVEDTQPCPACGAYVAAPAARCGRSDCPQVGAGTA